MFSEEEFREAMLIPCRDAEKAAIAARDAYEDRDGGWFIYGAVFSALSTVSPWCAARVREWLGETDAQAAARLETFQKTLAKAEHDGTDER